MNIVKVQLASLHYDPTNARKHDKRNIDTIAALFAKFGQQKPIVIDGDNIILAGNGSVEAMKHLGWTECYANKSELTGAEAIAYAIGDNKSAELATWELETLGSHLQGLQEDGFELEELGFEVADLAAFDNLADGGSRESSEEDDEVPEVPQNVHNVKLGQIWQLGKHRLMCGDSTDRASVEKLMNGEKADMVFTDPPYGMNLDTDYAKTMNVGGKSKMSNTHFAKSHQKVIGDDSYFDPSPFLDMAKEVFLFGADYYAKNIPGGGSWIVWDKTGSESMDKSYGSNFELCWSKLKHKREIARITYSGFLGVKDDAAQRVHPTQKPVQLATWFLDRWGKDTKLVADLFLGSGSTLIACEKTSRSCFGMELDPHYCSVIIERYQQYSNKTAVVLEEATE